MKIKSTFLMAVILIMTQAAAFAQTSPEETMQKICNAFFYLDENALKDMNNSAEQVREQYVRGFENSNTEIKFSNEQANKIADVLIDSMRKKIKFSVKTESLDGNKAVVAVTITGLKFKETMNDIQFDATGLTKEQLTEKMVNEIIDKIKNVAVREPVTVKFTLNYDPEIDFWAPEGNGENNLTPLFDAALN